MPRPAAPRLLMAAALAYVPACDQSSVQLPHDAAHPMRPAAAVPASEAASPKKSAPDPLAAAAPETEATVSETADVKRASRGYVSRIVKPALGEATLAHRVYRARFGPSSQTGAPTAVVLTRNRGQVGGFALSEGERFPFPSLHDSEPDGALLDRVAAVVFRDLDPDPDPELVVLIAYHDDDDPQGVPYFSNVVLDWDATAGRFVRLERIEGEVEAMQTAGEVLAHLRKLGLLATTPAR